MKKIIFAVILVLCFATVSFATWDIIVRIPDNEAKRTRRALCQEWDYRNECHQDAEGICTESRNDFISRKLRKYVKDTANNRIKYEDMIQAEIDANQVEFD